MPPRSKNELRRESGKPFFFRINNIYSNNKESRYKFKERNGTFIIYTEYE